MRVDFEAGNRRDGWVGGGSDRRSARLAGALLVTACLSAGCGEPPEQIEQEAPPATAVTPPGGPPRAIYQTLLTFVAFGREPSLLHLRFENRTAPAGLHLDYRGWTAAPQEWRPLLALRDSIPVPRAAWRVVPVGPLRVRVAEGAELASLVLRTPPAATDGGPEAEAPSLGVRLDAEGEIAAWAGATGQQETLRLARLSVDGRSQPGLLLTRQRARREAEPASRSVAQYFLIADSLGTGLLIMRDRATPETLGTARAWIDGLDSEWSDVTVLALSAPQGSTGRWSVQIPEAGIFVELQAVSPELDALAEDGPGYRVYRVDGALRIGTEGRPVWGVGVEETAP